MHGYKMRIVTGTYNDIFEDAPDLVLVFAKRETLTSFEFVPKLYDRFPGAVIAGCSTAGQFHNDDLVDDEALISTLHFEHSTIKSSTAAISDPSMSRDAGLKLGVDLNLEGLVAVLVLSDGTNCNGSALVEGLASELAESVTIFGGLAADQDKFEETVVLADRKIESKMVVAIGFYGDRLEVTTGSEGGWEKFGPERKITSSNANVLYELDGEPALGLYSRYLGDRAEDLPGSALLFPLAIRAPGTESHISLVRTILGVDFEDSSMTFAGNIPQGWSAQLMRASFDALIDGAESAGNKLRPTKPASGNGLCIAVSCVGRRLVLGQRADEEVEAVADLLDPVFELFGFYSYGELAPGFSGQCELHNQTMTLTAICEI